MNINNTKFNLINGVYKISKNGKIKISEIEQINKRKQDVILYINKEYKHYKNGKYIGSAKTINGKIEKLLPYSDARALRAIGERDARVN